MYSQRVRLVMNQAELLTASPDVAVSEAARLLASNEVGAVVVVEEGRVVGIFTDRDAVLRVLAPGIDPHTTALAQVMTSAPLTISPERTFGYALRLMHEHRIRHMPVVEDSSPIGIVCSRDALDPELEEFVCEAIRREALR